MPKPHTLTPEVQERFLKNLTRCGGFIEVAAALSKIKRRTLYDWFTRGEAGEEPFASLLEEVLERRADAAREQIGEHRRLAEQNGPHAAAASQFLLSALFPSQFGQKAQLTAAVNEEVQRLLDAIQPLMSEGAYGELVNALAALAGDGRVATEEADGTVAAEAHGETVPADDRPALPASADPDEGTG